MTPRPQSPTQDPLYASKMSRADRKKLANAKTARGLDDEIALLHLQLDKLVDNDPDNIPLIFKGADLIVRAVAAKTRVAKNSPEDLDQAVIDSLREAADTLGLDRVPWSCECGTECHSQS